jgi:hypothetical protein
MGYSFEDFFDDQLAKQLTALFREEQTEDTDLADKFFNVLKNALGHTHRGDDFARRLLELATDPEDIGMAPDQFVKRSFQLRYGYDDLEIRKLEYRHPDGTVVSANYQGDESDTF